MKNGNAGGALFAGNSKLFLGPLGVVQIGWDGWDLGKTTADTELAQEEDIKDIIYQQGGTKYEDKVRTGLAYMVKATFGEISTGLLTKLVPGISSENTSSASDSGSIGRCLFQSMRDEEAKVCRVVAVDCNGFASSEDEDTLSFWEVVPVVDGTLLQWGADTQRNVPVTFFIFYHPFAVGESVAKLGGFGYWGDPVVEDVPAIVWPDSEAPYVASASVTAATTLVAVFNENIAVVAAVTLNDRLFVTVDGINTFPVTSVIQSGNEILMTFAAATFAAGDTVNLFMSVDSVEDLAAIPNLNEALSDFDVLNTL